MNHLDAFLQALKADAAVIHRPENIRWLSGYSGEGCLFVAPGVSAILTDFRYIEAAGRQAPGWQVERTTSERKEEQVLRELAGDHGVRTLCLEEEYLTHDQGPTLEKGVEGVELLCMVGRVR